MGWWLVVYGQSKHTRVLPLPLEPTGKQLLPAPRTAEYVSVSLSCEYVTLLVDMTSCSGYASTAGIAQDFRLCR